MNRKIGVGIMFALAVGAGLGMPFAFRAKAAPSAKAVKLPDAVTFYGSPQSPISSGVVIPAGRAFVWTSGTVPPVADAKAAEGSRERYGDTKTQAEGILKTLQTQLKAQGLTLSDVVYLRVYVVPDKLNGDKPDFKGWFAAYGEFFGTKTNPTKVARSTIAVPTLVSPDWLIEIEAFAVFPK